jgi:UDP-N-acetylglucosamine--N-acetylmuramyl-(pentapeptide) pyrophosphoryl-undecaprenol N-acetylglucosamine transferase
LTGAGVTAPRVVVAGGHSAGHIEPAMNFADALRRLEPTAEITALGTVRGLDTTLIIPARGYPLELIPPAPLPRKLNRALLQAPGRLRDSVLAAGAVLDHVRAEVVVGFGGYVAGPAYLAACRQGLPIVVHKANARPGVASRLAARMTTHVFTAAPRPAGSRHRHQDPAAARDHRARPARAARRGPAAVRPATRRAGTDGHRRLAGRPGDQRRGVRRGRGAQSGRRAGAAHHRAAEHGRGAGRRPAGPPYVVIPHVEEMQYAYAAADFVICRSGAMTCAELAAVGLPAAYVPLPLRGGEQRLNADPAVAADGALLVDDAGLDPAWIETTLIPVLTDPGRIAAMSARASAAGAPDADAVLARHVLTAVAERRGLAS